MYAIDYATSKLYNVRKLRGHMAYAIYELDKSGRHYVKTAISTSHIAAIENHVNADQNTAVKQIDRRTILKLLQGE